MLSIDLSGRLAVITGATGQLGRVMTGLLSDCGADIAVHYNSNSAKAASLVEEIRAKGRFSNCRQVPTDKFPSKCIN